MDLTPLTDACMLPVMIARALGLLDPPGRTTMATVTGFIAERRSLVVLDNCEHLLDACAALTEDLVEPGPLQPGRKRPGMAGVAAAERQHLPERLIDKLS